MDSSVSRVSGTVDVSFYFRGVHSSCWGVHGGKMDKIRYRSRSRGWIVVFLEFPVPWMSRFTLGASIRPAWAFMVARWMRYGTVRRSRWFKTAIGMMEILKKIFHVQV